MVPLYVLLSYFLLNFKLSISKLSVYYELCPDYDPSDPNDEVYIAHWPGGLDGDGFDILTMKHIMDRNFGRKDYSATIL